MPATKPAPKGRPATEVPAPGTRASNVRLRIRWVRVHGQGFIHWQRDES